MVNSMLSYSGLSEGFWGEAMLTACYLLNRIPNKRNKVTPYELWHKKTPNLSYLKIWGCRAVRTQHNLADHLTKGLSRDLVKRSAVGLGLKSI